MLRSGRANRSETSLRPAGPVVGAQAAHGPVRSAHKTDGSGSGCSLVPVINWDTVNTWPALVFGGFGMYSRENCDVVTHRRISVCSLHRCDTRSALISRVSAELARRHGVATVIRRLPALTLNQIHRICASRFGACKSASLNAVRHYHQSSREEEYERKTDRRS